MPPAPRGARISYGPRRMPGWSVNDGKCVDYIRLGDNKEMESDGTARRRRASVTRYESANDADRNDLDFWRQIPEGERILQAWRLTQEQWRLADLPDESGLCRSVASVRRR